MDNIGKNVAKFIRETFAGKKQIFTSWSPEGVGKEQVPWLKITAALMLKWKWSYLGSIDDCSGVSSVYYIYCNFMNEIASKTFASQFLSPESTVFADPFERLIFAVKNSTSLHSCRSSRYPLSSKPRSADPERCKRQKLALLCSLLKKPSDSFIFTSFMPTCQRVGQITKKPIPFLRVFGQYSMPANPKHLHKVD